MDIFDENREVDTRFVRSNNPEDFANRIAVIPEWKADLDPLKEYRDYPEERIWCPMPKIDETWVPLLMFMRSVLTCAQERGGIPNEEAMENSCTGQAEQYISDVIHESAFIPEVAIRRLATSQFPDKLVERWTSSEIDSFARGLKTYGKKFALIRAEFMPYKTTKDLVEFYYTWKRTKESKGLVASRARRFLRRRSKPSNLIIGSPSIAGVLTRSQLAAVENSGTPPCTTRSSRKDVFTAVKRKRRSSKQTRPVLIKV